MAAQVVTHRAVLQLNPPVPQEVPVGSAMKIEVGISCPSGCSLIGGTVRLVAGDETLAARELVAYDEETGISRTEALTVRAPEHPGSHAWTMLFPRQEVDGVVHDQVSVPVAFITGPLATSLAVWGVPSPVIAGEQFTVKVGARSSGSCALQGASVELLDEVGALVGSGQLGSVPLEGTTALYWTEVDLVAPAQEGIGSWSARFAATKAGLPHAEAVARFSFATVKPPDHRLTISIIDKDTGTPIENAQVRLGPFRASTDACGRAELSIPKGAYEIKIWHAGYETPAMPLEVSDDLAVQLEAVAVPEEDPSARFMM